MQKAILFMIGLGLGGVLGITWLNARKPVAPSVQSVPAASPSVPASLGEDKPRRERLPLTLPWTAIESTNYAQYVANLRGIGCPEGTIADILNAEIRQALGPVKQAGSKPNIEGMLEREKAVRQLMEALGLPPVTEPGDFFFSTEQLRQIREAFRMAPMERGSPARFAQAAARRRELIGPLSPEQELYLRSEFEAYGATVDLVLAGFVPTQQEYYAMIAAMEDNTVPALTSKLRSILAPARYTQYIETQTPEHVAAFRFGQQHPQAQGKETQLRQILQSKSSLSLQEYRNQLRALLDRDTFDRFFEEHPHQ